MNRITQWIFFPIAAIAGLVAIAYLVGLMRSPEIAKKYQLRSAARRR